MSAVVLGVTPLQCCAEAEGQEQNFSQKPQQTLPFLVGWNCEPHVHALNNHRQGKESIISGLE